MSLTRLGFGVEIEASVKPTSNRDWSIQRHYAKFAEILDDYGLAAHTGTGKYPSNYRKWWITSDSSISSIPNCISMESVSPIMKSDGDWESVIRSFWEAMTENFQVQKNLSCGTHVHVAPLYRDYTLSQAKTIAFACCYYEPYVISVLPVERRDYRYCRRNTKVAPAMGAVYRRQTPGAMREMARDIKQTNNFRELCEYVQGGMDQEYRTVLWNFQNLARSSGTGTIEFRGGRHMRGPVRTTRWITFTLVFVLMALDENLLDSSRPYYVPNNDMVSEVSTFWKRFRSFAEDLDMDSNLPSHFKMMSEKMAESSETESESNSEIDYEYISRNFDDSETESRSDLGIDSEGEVEIGNEESEIEIGNEESEIDSEEESDIYYYSDSDSDDYF